MTFRLIIFDFDGTLADSEPWMIDTFNGLAQRYGLKALSRDEIERLRGRDNRAIIRELGVRWWQLPRIAAHMRKLAQAAPPPPLFAGVPEMLRALHAGGRTLAIVSSNSEAAIRRALGPENAALISLYACNASLFGKAAKFREAMTRARISKGAARDQVLAIGDETRDIDAARKAGIACAAVAWGYATPGLLKQHAPDLFFTRVEEIAQHA